MWTRAEGHSFLERRTFDLTAFSQWGRGCPSGRSSCLSLPAPVAEGIAPCAGARIETSVTYVYILALNGRSRVSAGGHPSTWLSSRRIVRLFQSGGRQLLACAKVLPPAPLTLVAGRTRSPRIAVKGPTLRCTVMTEGGNSTSIRRHPDRAALPSDIIAFVFFRRPRSG